MIDDTVLSVLYHVRNIVLELGKDEQKKPKQPVTGELIIWDILQIL